MNSVSLVGTIVADPEVKYTNGGTTLGRFRLAVDRAYSKEKETDFISCVAFGKTAEFLEKYFHKGMKIGLTGRIQTGSYTNKDNQKVYTTDVIAENVEFVERKSQDGSNDQQKPQKKNDDFINVPDSLEEELPFN
jgi:single-strand DNA-binding protein